MMKIGRGHVCCNCHHSPHVHVHVHAWQLTSMGFRMAERNATEQNVLHTRMWPRHKPLLGALKPLQQAARQAQSAWSEKRLAAAATGGTDKGGAPTCTGVLSECQKA